MNFTYSNRLNQLKLENKLKLNNQLKNKIISYLVNISLCNICYINLRFEIIELLFC